MQERFFVFTAILGALLAGCVRSTAVDIAPTPGAPAAESDAPAQPKQEVAQNAAAGKVAAPASADMVKIAGGEFMMGDKDEVDAPPHRVVVSPFYMDKYLVTQEQFQQLVGSNPSRWKSNGKNPVEQMRWSDAVRFCNTRSERDGLKPAYDVMTWQCDFDASGYRLPTEAEWEYACRAGTTTPFYFGNDEARLGDHAWFDKNSGGHPRPVGQKKPNPWGLYDMCGNVWQWCHDIYQVDYYQQSPEKDPRGPSEGKTRVLRGGAWRFSAENCRSGFRYNENPGYADVCFGYDIYGFRCVRRVSPDELAQVGK